MIDEIERLAKENRELRQQMSELRAALKPLADFRSRLVWLSLPREIDGELDEMSFRAKRAFANTEPKP